MAKRNKPAKRRDRKVGSKTYAGKTPHQYSGAYQSWRSHFKTSERRQHDHAA